MGRLDGKVSLVTGAGSGIGEQMALKAASEAATVLCADIDGDSARATADRIEDLGGSAASMQVDVTDEDAVRGVLDAAESEFGGLDVIYNNAGISRSSWEATLGVNLTGMYYMLLHGAPKLRALGGGAIVSTASIAGLVGLSRANEDPDAPMNPGRAAYTASKSGVVGLTKQFAVAFAPFNVRINAVAPGFIYTPMTARLTGEDAEHEHAISLHPMGRLGQPEEIAAAATFLVSDEASFITGVTLPVDGGYTAQ